MIAGVVEPCRRFYRPSGVWMRVKYIASQGQASFYNQRTQQRNNGCHLYLAGLNLMPQKFGSTSHHQAGYKYSDNEVDVIVEKASAVAAKEAVDHHSQQFPAAG